MDKRKSYMHKQYIFQNTYIFVSLGNAGFTPNNNFKEFQFPAEK
ncbi:hypothetical protein SAMN05518672_103425 [Chitinophaga sp. CF118]|nr:hypothetical protein SAMN05518672_103425 [Chitinophaga sp. CF118]